MGQNHTLASITSSTWCRQASNIRSWPSTHSSWTHTPLFWPVFTAAVSKLMAWTLSVMFHHSIMLNTALATYLAVPAGSFGTPRSLSTHSPETKLAGDQHVLLQLSQEGSFRPSEPQANTLDEIWLIQLHLAPLCLSFSFFWSELEQDQLYVNK